MRIAELSRATGVPVPTIKYYVREGLLPPGELTSPNQAQYDQGHVRRLKLVRALIEVGGVSVAAVRDAVRRIDAPDVDLHAKLGATHYLLGAAAPLSIDAATWNARRRRPTRCSPTWGGSPSARTPPPWCSSRHSPPCTGSARTAMRGSWPRTRKRRRPPRGPTSPYSPPAI